MAHREKSHIYIFATLMIGSYGLASFRTTIIDLPPKSRWCYRFARFNVVAVHLSLPRWIGLGKRPPYPPLYFFLIPGLSPLESSPSPVLHPRRKGEQVRSRSPGIPRRAEEKPRATGAEPFVRPESSSSPVRRSPAPSLPRSSPTPLLSAAAASTARWAAGRWPEVDPDLHFHNPEPKQV